MSSIESKRMSALIDLVREALEDPKLSEPEVRDRELRWDSHQTLHIIFGAEQIFCVEFTSEQMESVEDFDGLLAVIEQSLTAPCAFS